ncbi:MAG: hypothetical protein IPI53_00290 [Saprospiraceae bacterium]|nr:hypothetical protein [Saprospiraceae bacterium]
MTTGQRDAIASPASGLIIYNTTTNSLEISETSSVIGSTESRMSDASSSPITIQIGYGQKWMPVNNLGCKSLLPRNKGDPQNSVLPTSQHGQT